MVCCPCKPLAYRKADQRPTPERKTLAQAIAPADSRHWYAAPEVKMAGLIDSNVWVQIPHHTESKVVGTKIIFKVKVGPNDGVGLYKRRFDAQRF